MAQQATIVNPAKVEELTHTMREPGRAYQKIQELDSIRIYNCFGRASAFLPGPQGFIVDSPPNSGVAAHWHPVNQFQLYVGAPGAWYQRTMIEKDLVLHFTDAYSTYGPFGAHGPGRFKYHVMRARASDTTGWMPDDRDKMPRRGRRNYLVPLTLSSRVEHGDWATIIEPEEDGLAAYRVLVGPTQGFEPPSIAVPAVGRFYCVLAGSLWLGEEEFPASSMLWQDRGQELPILVADSSTGCDVLAVQFPPEGDAAG